MSSLIVFIVTHWEMILGGLAFTWGVYQGFWKEKRTDKATENEQDIKIREAQITAEQNIRDSFKVLHDQLANEVTRLGLMVASQAGEIKILKENIQQQEIRHKADLDAQEQRHESSRQAQREAHAKDIAERDQQIAELRARIIELEARGAAV